MNTIIKFSKAILLTVLVMCVLVLYHGTVAEKDCLNLGHGKNTCSGLLN